MTHATVSETTAGVGRLGTTAAWISAVCCLPYLVLKVVWTLDMPVGVTDRSELDSDGWLAANALMAGLQLAGLLLVLALTRSWAHRVPAWLVLFPAWVGTGLLFQVVVGAVLMGVFAPPSQASEADLGGFQPWVYAMVYTAFAGQGVALAIAFACHVRGRWGWLLRERTGHVVGKQTWRLRSRPVSHLPVMAQTVAGLAVAVGVVCAYWAGGGSFGLSDAQPHPPWYLQVSRVAGALVAAAGLLGVAGRWGAGTRFGLPAALLWFGSGALVAFDGLNLLMNELFALFGAAGSDSGWSLSDSVLTTKVLIGVLAAAVGALVIAAAAEDHQHLPRAPGSEASDGAGRPAPRRLRDALTVPKEVTGGSGGPDDDGDSDRGTREGLRSKDASSRPTRSAGRDGSGARLPGA